MALTDLDALQKHRASMSEDDSKAFTDKFGMHPVRLTAGTQLYKYSGPYPFDEKTHHWSPWWNARSGTQHTLADGRKIAWSGLSERLTKAMTGNFSEVRQARIRSAVKYNWNTMANLFIATLNAEVAWAWFGQCRGQRISDEQNPGYQNLYLIGGDYQYFIPGLQRHEIRILSAHCGSDEGKV